MSAGDVRRRQIKGIRLRLLQFAGRSDESSDGDEWSDPGVEAAVRGVGAAQGRAQGTSEPAVYAARVWATHAGAIMLGFISLFEYHGFIAVVLWFPLLLVGW